jgi:hypothetical protein
MFSPKPLNHRRSFDTPLYPIPALRQKIGMEAKLEFEAEKAKRLAKSQEKKKKEENLRKILSSPDNR